MIVLLSACSKPYYGYTRDEWNNLPEKEKAAVKAEYQQAIDAKNSQQQMDLIEEHRQKTIDFGTGMKTR